jgi:putative endonuclease
VGRASYERGRSAEASAQQALAAAGFRIIESNYRVLGAELDVVCRDDQSLAFVEVRGRGPGATAPSATVGSAKLKFLMRGVRAWLGKHGQATADWRFLVVEVSLDTSGHPIATEIIEDPFVHLPEFHRGNP